MVKIAKFFRSDVERNPEIFRGTALQKVGLSLQNRDSWQLAMRTILLTISLFMRL